jgi:hypothetical protein
MAGFVDAVRSGAWLTPERRHVYAWILLAFTVVVPVFWIALSDNLIDHNGNPIGTDFSNVYAAGTLTLAASRGGLRPAAPARRGSPLRRARCRFTAGTTRRCSFRRGAGPPSWLGAVAWIA